MTITPATGFAIENVTANGEDCTDRLDKGVLHYDEISDTLAIAVKFAPIMFDIKLPADLKGGHIEVNGSADAPAQLQYGQRVELRPVADEGYLLKSMNVNGAAVTLDSEGVYTIASLTESITVDAVFEILSSGAAAVGADAITVTVRNRTVVIAGAADDAVAEVYDAAGLRCYSGLKRTIALDKAGVYIVTISGQTFKVMLR